MGSQLGHEKANFLFQSTVKGQRELRTGKSQKVHSSGSVGLRNKSTVAYLNLL